MPRKKAKTPPPINIRRARLSFLWSEVLPDFLDNKIPAGSPFASLTRGFLYPRLFEDARLGKLTNPRLQNPWIAERRQQFWMRYLVQGKLTEVPGRQAWEYLVPLRLDDNTLHIQAAGFKGTLFLDRFCYPFGIAAALTFRWEEELPLDDFVNRSWALSQTGIFSVEGNNAPLSLNALGDLVLALLRKTILGDNSIQGYRSPQPFSIVTILEADGVDPGADAGQNRQVLTALEILSKWPADRKFLSLPKPGDVCLGLKQTVPAGSALYAQESGRAVWHPELFRFTSTPSSEEAIDQVRRSSKLGCYHRNLFFASLQTECLGRLVMFTAQQFVNGKAKTALSQPHRDMVANAARCMVKLYSGDKGNTYRSESTTRQIDQTFRPSLMAILAQFPVATLPAAPGTNPAQAAAPTPAVPATPSAVSSTGKPAMPSAGQSDKA